MEAMVSFDEAEKLLADPWERGLAMVHEAQLFVRASNPEAVEVGNRLTALDSPAAPLGLIVAGVYELQARTPVALDLLRNGFARIRRPRALDEFDFPWVYAALHAAAARESDPERLFHVAAVFAEIGRLQPLSTRVARDHAELLLRARRFDAAAERFLAAGDVLEAADAFAQGGLHLRAAALYRSYVDLQPAANAVGLYRRADQPEERGRRGRGDRGLRGLRRQDRPLGQVRRRGAARKAELQGDDEALATFDRILKAREVADPRRLSGLGPGAPGPRPGVASRRPGRRRAKTLESTWSATRRVRPRRPGRFAAASSLVATAVQELDWKQALDRLRTLAAIAGKVPEIERAPFAEHLRDLKSREAEILFQLEDYAGAYRAYVEAEQRPSDVEDRLRALLGRGRALARLARMDEAKRDYSSAKAMMDGQSFVGAQRDYWDLALDLLGKELR
jgi:tetratricopeptide (TPR) repeat protein